MTAITNESNSCLWIPHALGSSLFSGPSFNPGFWRARTNFVSTAHTAVCETRFKTPLLSELSKNASGFELRIATNYVLSNYSITTTLKLKVSSSNCSVHMELQLSNYISYPDACAS